MSADPVPPPAAIDPALQVRRQARLRRRRRRLGWTAAAVGLLLVIGWVFYLSPFLTVSRVNVEGAHVATDDQVRQAAGIAKGSSLAGLNAHAIEQRVAKLPVMASCHLTRSWPSSVTLQVTERKLVYQAQDAGSFQWTDETGAVFNMTKDAQQAPIAHLPGNASQQLRADVATALDSLTPQVKSRVQAVSASSSDNILLQLDNDQAVFWGSADQSGDKAALLPVLLGQGGATFDISSVSHPAVK